MYKKSFFNYISNLFRKDCVFSVKNENKEQDIFLFMYSDSDDYNENIEAPKYLSYFYKRNLWSEADIFSYIFSKIGLPSLISIINNSETLYDKTMSSVILVYSDQYSWELIRELILWYVKYIEDYLFKKTLYPMALDSHFYFVIMSFLTEINNPECLKNILSLLKTNVVDYLNEENSFQNQELYVYKAYQQFLHHCSDVLSYPDFYEAWHNKVSSEIWSDNRIIDQQMINLPYYITINTQTLNSITDQKLLFKDFRNYLRKSISKELKNEISQQIKNSQDVADLKEVFLDLKEILQTENIALILGNDKPSQLLQEFCDQLSDFVQIDWNR
jgi:hypothetical protein